MGTFMLNSEDENHDPISKSFKLHPFCSCTLFNNNNNNNNNNNHNNPAFRCYCFWCTFEMPDKCEEVKRCTYVTQGFVVGLIIIDSCY